MSIITVEEIKDMREQFESRMAIFSGTERPLPWRLEGKITQEEWDKKEQERLKEIKERLGLLQKEEK